MHTLLKPVTRNPRLVFLIDALGAMLTFVFIYVILIQFQEHIGLSKSILKTLSFGAFFLMCYSSFCFILIKRKWRPFLWIIILFNLTYSIISIYLVLNSKTITTLGQIYFTLELIVILIVISIEYKTLLRIKSK